MADDLVPHKPKVPRHRVEPPQVETHTPTYDGVVVDFWAKSEWGGWGFIHVQTDVGIVKCSGTVEHLRPGIGLEVGCRGTWTNNQHGWTFKLSVVTVEEPTTESSFAAWLQGSAKTVGHALATRIAAKYTAEQFWETLKSDPDEFLQLSGVGKAVLKNLQALSGKRIEQQMMTQLLEAGLTNWMIEKAIKKWGASTASTVIENPYSLCELDGIGWRTADKVAQHQGLEADDPRRVAAALYDVVFLWEREQGGTWINSYDLLDSTVGLLHLPPETVETAIRDAITDGKLHHVGERVYRMPMWHAEERIARVAASKPYVARASIGTVSDEDSHLTEDQRAAVMLALNNPLTIITGGPGTGKTTIIRAILNALEVESVALMAPTGKAAKRMTQATGREAATIHRALGYNPALGWGYKVDPEWTCASVVIVDEFSMVDQLLAGHVFRASVGAARVILVGDVHQLPPVGAGQVLRDLIDSKCVPVAELTEVHRSAASSWMAMNAPRILAGDELDFASVGFVDSPLGTSVPSAVMQAVNWCITSGHGMPQILAPQRKGPAGVYQLNTTLQKAYNHSGGETWMYKRDDYSWMLRKDDPVMQTVNDYEKKVFNGDVGKVTYVGPKSLTVMFADGLIVSYTKRSARQLALAYALTVHKSQGSEYPWLVVVTHPSHGRMLTKELLYTAVTRAKTGVFLVGTKEAAQNAADRAEALRNSSLCETIRTMSAG